ncbi:MAG: Mrp/NBP35 family ATP-binding protein [Firmicutes bacterium]|nr:Mrp/NBP35 family ATP-binding protein [Bacillota bacterium]
MSENCNHDCSNCQANCADRKVDFSVPQNKYSDVKHVIGVVSGKGGVGKSMVTSLLANEARKSGFRTAILDADITGPSIPRAFGVDERPTANEECMFPPETANGVKLMSMNLLLDDDTAPVVWRGPVIAGAVKQFWSDVCWGEIDYMFVDMPPGTGDVPLTVFQSLPIEGIVIVTTPQDLVAMIVEKAVNMARMMNVPVVGFVENMSFVRCPNCGEEIRVFGESRVDGLAEAYGVAAVAKLPLDPRVAEAADEGTIEDFESPELAAFAKQILK